jgi:hypothetical protein
VVTSGADEMLHQFTAAGVLTFSTGKYKKPFDFMVLVQRPLSFYKSTNFGMTAVKTQMMIKALNK